ncbi:MAG: hypothetical protein U0N20_00525 [Clostridium sp.]
MLGIEKFINYFQGHENEYVIIGGTACELLMNAEELPFRATKDIDMVLIVESLTIEFGKLFWNFIYEAGYQSTKVQVILNFIDSLILNLLNFHL